MKSEHYPSLFDPPREVNVPLSNKIDSYYSDDVKRKRVTQKDQILETLRTLGEATQRELSEATGLPRHVIPDRILTLIAEEKVVISGKCFDPFTNKEVTVYKPIAGTKK